MANSDREAIKNKYISNIINAKKWYNDAVAAGNTEEAEKIANNSQKNSWYDWLRNNGFNKEANTLEKSDYATAAESAKNGKVALRDYSQKLGLNSYGLNKNQVNSMIKYDNDTGQVTIGGKNIGAPIEIDGVSYMDADVLNEAFANAMTDLGISVTDEVKYNQKMDEVMTQQSDNNDFIKSQYNDFNNQQKDLTDTALNEDFMNQDWAKSLMGYYNWNGQTAANSEAASSAASNGGNIDSFAAANAARQQLAYTNAGVNAVANNWLERLGVAQGNLSLLNDRISNTQTELQSNIQLGMNQAQQLFDNDETRKNNEFNREQTALLNESEITGYIPEALKKKNNQFFDADGNLKNENIDFQNIINKANEILSDGNATEAQKADARKTLEDATYARQYKTGELGYDDYGIVTMSVAPEENAAMRTNRYNRQNALDVITTQGSQDRLTNKELFDQDMSLAKLQRQWDVEDMNKQRQWELEDNAYDAFIKSLKTGSSSSSKNSSKNTGGSNEGSNGQIDVVTQDMVNDVVQELGKLGIGYQIGTDGNLHFGNLSDKDVHTIVSKVSNLSNLTENARYSLMQQLGLSQDQINAKSSAPYK